MKPGIHAFFDPDTYTVSYVVHDPDSMECAVVDPVLDYDPVTARCREDSAQKIIAYIRQQKLKLRWILETHAHADHLSGAQVIKRELGGDIAIGQNITTVQQSFAPLFDLDASFATDGSQFDHLFADGETFSLGSLSAQVLFTPGHTPACVSYLIADACFVGDTLFMPDYGTARTDFPGGDAAELYQSITRILSLPSDTRLFMCHDYMPGGREVQWETTVAEQKAKNIMVNDQISQSDYVAARKARDAKLAAPRLILPSLQVNIQAGQLPAAHDNGIAYLNIPLNRLGSPD